MNCSLFKVRYRTDLYEWGKGWLDNDKAKRWRLFLTNFKNAHWTVILPEFGGDCFRLASVYSSVYLHPMSGILTLDNEREVSQVREIITNAVKRCGGRVEFREQEVSFKLEV